MDLARLEHLEQRLNVLEAGEAIRNLIGRYATAADQKNTPIIMQQLFHKNAVWSAKGFGEYIGKDKIIQALSDIAAQQVLWSLHVMGQPDLQIAPDAKTATARWVLWELSTLAQGNQEHDHWLGGYYQCTLSPDAAGIWRFDRVELNLTLNSPYTEGFQRLNQ